MLDNISPYKCYFIQKASPSNGDAFDFSYIYKFYTDRTDKYQRLKYIIRVEAHDSVFALKFYAARDRKLDKKYNRILQAHGYTNSLRIFVTCAYLVPEILKKHPNASFAINGASSIDIYSRKREGKYDSQRFRIYKVISNILFTRDKFEHYEFKEISSYLMVNKICGDVNTEKDRIKEMFLDRYEFNL